MMTLQKSHRYVDDTRVARSNDLSCFFASSALVLYLHLPARKFPRLRAALWLTTTLDTKRHIKLFHCYVRSPHATAYLFTTNTMKFCKNLQRVVDISDPEWAPYWTNYKMLKVRRPSFRSVHGGWWDGRRSLVSCLRDSQSAIYLVSEFSGWRIDRESSRIISHKINESLRDV